MVTTQQRRNIKAGMKAWLDAGYGTALELAVYESSVILNLEGRTSADCDALMAGRKAWVDGLTIRDPENKGSFRVSVWRAARDRVADLTVPGLR